MPSAIAPLETENASTLSELNRVLDALSMRAGWNKREPSLWPFPRTAFRPFLWRWRDAREALDAAGRLITTAETERRNLLLPNPIEGNAYASVRTLVCAYQMILPGERARSHRHTPNALRLVLEAGGGVYTVVDGVRLDMSAGDVVLTPGWSWHGHANDGDAPAYWVDFLDVPLVHLLEPMFLENWPDGFQTPDRVETESAWLFDWKSTRSALDAGAGSEGGAANDGRGVDGEGKPGARIELGSPALPTMALHMQRFAAGASTRPGRTSANRIICVVAGSGSTSVENEELVWERGDVFVVPSWHRYRHHSHEEAVLFSVSDEPAQRVLGFLRRDEEA